MEIERNEIIKKAIDTYGIDAQCLMAIEEMSELTKAICKESRARGKDNYTLVLANIGEEIADVRIMLDQLCIIFGIDTKELETHKLVRLKERLEQQK